MVKRVDPTRLVNDASGWGNAGSGDIRDIYLRKTFTIDKIPKMIGLRVLHDDAAEVYINGKPVKAFSRWSRVFVDIPLTGKPDYLRKGENTIAVHSHQDGGGQGIDVEILGIID